LAARCRLASRGEQQEQQEDEEGEVKTKRQRDVNAPMLMSKRAQLFVEIELIAKRIDLFRRQCNYLDD
jgi:hypothetical protein